MIAHSADVPEQAASRSRSYSSRRLGARDLVEIAAEPRERSDDERLGLQRRMQDRRRVGCD